MQDERVARRVLTSDLSNQNGCLRNHFMNGGKAPVWLEEHLAASIKWEETYLRYYNSTPRQIPPGWGASRSSSAAAGELPAGEQATQQQAEVGFSWVSVEVSHTQLACMHQSS